MKTPRRRMTPDELAAAKDRANQKRRLRRLWASDCSFEEICEEMGMAEDEMREYAAALGLADRPEPDFFLPTPEEIKEATYRLRMSWTQAERDARLGRMELPTRSDYGAGRDSPNRRPEGGQAPSQARRPDRRGRGLEVRREGEPHGGEGTD